MLKFLTSKINNYKKDKIYVKSILKYQAIKIFYNY